MPSTSERIDPHAPPPAAHAAPHAPHSAASDASAGHRGMLNGTFVRILIAAIVAAVIAMMDLMFNRWRAVPEPSAVILVQGDDSDDGAEIVVTSSSYPSDRVIATFNP